MRLRNRPPLLRAGLLALGLLALIGSAVAEDQRVWSDRTGKYKIPGKLVGFLNGVVTLERENGSRVSIALSKLSNADRDYVQKAVEASKKGKDGKADPAGKGDPNDPFQPGGAPGGGGEGELGDSRPGRPGRPGGQQPPPGRGGEGELGDSRPGRAGGGQQPPAGRGTPNDDGDRRRRQGMGQQAPGGRTTPPDDTDRRRRQGASQQAPGGRGTPPPTEGSLEGAGTTQPGAPLPGGPAMEGGGPPGGPAPGGLTGQSPPGTRPGAPGGLDSGTPPGTPAGTAPAGLAGIAVANFWDETPGTARSVGLGNAADKFPLKSGPAPKPAKPAAPDPTPIPPVYDVFDTVKGLAISVPANKAVVARLSQRPGTQAATTRFYVCDLAEGKYQGVTRVTGNYSALSLSDDGDTLLVRLETGPFNKGETLELWSVAGKFSRLADFAPYGDLQGGDREVKRAFFAGRDRLVTVNPAGKVVVWDTAAGKPLYQVAGHADGDPAVSPDRTLLAVPAGKEVAVIDLAAGKALALLPAYELGRAAVAFSPNGQRLAHVSFNTITVFDLSTGEVAKSFAGGFPGFNDAEFQWADAGHVFTGQTVYSVEFGLPIWDYSGGEAARPGGEYTYFVVSTKVGKEGSAVVPALVPPAKAVKQLEAASRQPDFLILKPGSEVRVDETGVNDPLKRTQVRVALIRAAETAGYKVSDTAKVTLKANTGTAKEQDVSYRSFGESPFRGGKEYKVRPFYANVTLDYEGKVAWRAGSGGSTPMMLRLKDGQTVEQYLRTLEEPKYDFFEAVKLPAKLTKPLGAAVGQGLGSSRVTAAGAR